MAYTLNDNLKRWAEQYETAEFIQSDPVQIPHRYDSRVNIELAHLLRRGLRGVPANR